MGGADPVSTAPSGRQAWPLVLGVGAGLAQLVLPEALAIVALVAAAIAAGWVLPELPMRAAALFMAPAIALGLARALIEGAGSAVGALIVATVLAAVFVAVLTHVGAGVALRRDA